MEIGLNCTVLSLNLALIISTVYISEMEEQSASFRIRTVLVIFNLLSNAVDYFVLLLR